MTPAAPRRCAVLLALALVPLALADDKKLDDKVPLAWKVDTDTLLRFAVKPWPLEKAAKGPRKLARLPATRYGLLDRQIGTQGRDIYVRGRAWLPLYIGLQLPGARVKRGRRYTLTRAITTLSDVRDCQLTLGAREGEPTVVDGLTCRTFALRGVLVDTSKKTDGRRYAVASSRIVGRIQFHPRGHLIGGRVDLIWYLKQPKDKKARPREIRRRYQWQLDLVLPLKAPRLDKLVEEAITEGVAYLKSKQDKKTGNWKTSHTKTYPGGQAALGALALLSSGVKADDKQVARAMQLALDAPLKKVYSVGCTLMMIEAAHAPAAEVLEKLTPEQQAKAYAALPAKLTDAQKAYVKNATGWLLDVAFRERSWGYPHHSASYDYDNSCSQYAALGLLSARRLGGRVPLSIWSEIVDHWLADQDTAGKSVPVIEVGKTGGTASRVEQSARGWPYRRRPRYRYKTYGSMTCAGVASLAIARAELQRAGKLRPGDKRTAKVDAAIRDGLAWIQLHFRVDRHPAHATNGWHYYYLYGLERAGVLADVKHIGVHDWYRQGAAWLVSRRMNNKGWSDDVNDTCFALLFLKRATRPLIVISKSDR